LKAGYDVYAVEDASGGTSVTAHNAAMRRVEQAGAAPMTALQVLLEYQRDWARKETYDAVIGVVKEHCGAYGQGCEYAYTMVHGAPPAGAALKVDAMEDPANETGPLTVIVTWKVRKGREREFEAWRHEIGDAALKFPGHMGST